jgi:ketosteroid isomerase-like protein
MSTNSRTVNSLIATALLVVACAMPSQRDKSAPRETLLATERAFARDSVAHGVRAAFLAYFADDGINFQQGPVNTKESLRARPVPENPLASTLDWQPMVAVVAKADDLGFTTGPYTLTDNVGTRSPQHGVFFSVWQHEADGLWRVALDAGISAPSPVSPTALGTDPPSSETVRGDAQASSAATRGTLLALERQPLRINIPGEKQSSDYVSLIDGNTRLYRNGAAPIIGRDAIVLHYQGRRLWLDWAPIDGRVARSADFAYTYGRVSARDAAGALPPTRGWYVHLWLRDGAGNWKLAFDIELPA